MNNEKTSPSHSNASRASSKETRKSPQLESRQPSQNAEMIQSVRQAFKKALEEDPIPHFIAILKEGTLDELRNELLDIKRVLDIDGKMKRLSLKTIAAGNAFLKAAAPLLDSKKQVDRQKNELKQIQTLDKKNALLPEEKDDLRRTALQLRDVLQIHESLCGQALNFYSQYIHDRFKDLGEEAALRHSTEYYLQYVDSPQRARIEIQMREKMEGMPQERRIEALKLFIQMLVQISPSVRTAEVGRSIEMARLFREENHVDDALRELEKASEYNECTELFLEMAVCWKIKKERLQENASLRKAIKCDPNSIEPYLRLAQLYEEEGNAAASIPIYEKILELRPNHIPTLTHAARLAYDRKKWPLAIQWLVQLLQHKPHSQKTRMRLGIAFVQSGQIDRGLSTLQECQRRGMVEGQIDLYLGIAYRSQGHHVDAEQSFRQAVDRLPDNPEALFWLALTEFESGEYETAEKHCRLLLSKNTQNFSAMILLARSLNCLGESRQVIELLTPYVKEPKMIFGALLEYGIACMKVNQMEEAYVVFRKIINREPDNQEARNLLGQVCIQSGRFEEAMQYIAPQEN